MARVGARRTGSCRVHVVAVDPTFFLETLRPLGARDRPASRRFMHVVTANLLARRGRRPRRPTKTGRGRKAQPDGATQWTAMPVTPP
jgi:hypothetical protein